MTERATKRHYRIVCAAITVSLGLLTTLVCNPHPAFAGESLWLGSSGLFPDQVQPWALGDSSGAFNPALSGGILTLNTSVNSEFMYYIMNGADVTMPTSLTIETNLRVTNPGASSSAAREGTAILFTTGASVGNTLFIGNNNIFLLTATTTPGTKVSVDTTSAFHNYRIVASTQGVGGVINVFQDGNLVLTGATYSSTIDNATAPTIYFGDATSGARAASQWTSFYHNAATIGNVVTIPEPSTALLLLTPITFCFLRKRHSRRHQNS